MDVRNKIAFLICRYLFVEISGIYMPGNSDSPPTRKLFLTVLQAFQLEVEISLFYNLLNRFFVLNNGHAHANLSSSLNEFCQSLSEI